MICISHSMFFSSSTQPHVNARFLEAMDGPSNYVVDFTYSLDDNENMQLVLYWRIGGPTYHVNNPRLLRDEWPDDRIVQRKWVVRNRNDPGWRVILWRGGWQDWVANNEDLRLQSNDYLRQLCFAFLNAWPRETIQVCWHYKNTTWGDVRKCQWSSWQRSAIDRPKQ